MATPTMIEITRSARLPDPLRIGRYRKSPELGPSLLFFSGGTAINKLSRTLKEYTHNSTHFVTPFDSGGSSAKLRQAFDMPSIGDLRSRLMALADESVTGQPDVYRLFTYRFSRKAKQDELVDRLRLISQGKDPLIKAISNPMRRLIRNQLGYFCEAMPATFDLRGASIGNLILAGGYINNHQHLDPIIFLFSKLVNVLGTVRATVNDDLHLAADLRDGRRIIGQHRLTGKEVAALTSPIERLYLSSRLDRYAPAESSIRKKNRKLIERADLICFPPGSFYSSLLANLLPRGVGRAVAGNRNPKVYIPNLGQDPEQIGMDPGQPIERLLMQLRQDAGEDCPAERLLNIILIDRSRGTYTPQLPIDRLRTQGIQVIDTPLISDQSQPWYDPRLLAAALLSLT